MKLFLVFLITASSFVFAQNKNEENPIVASVGKYKIRKSTLMKYHAQNLKFVRSNKSITLESSLTDLINRTIGIQKGKANKLHKTPIVIKKLNDIIYHAQISKDLEPKFKKIGKVSDSEVMSYCKENPEYRTSQILYRLRTQPSQDDVAKALDQSLSVYNEVFKKPENFSKVAKKYSQTENSKIGGDLGFQPKTRLSKEFYEAIKGKSKGYITKPFRTQYGIHIVKVTDIKDCKDIDKNLYKKIVYDIKRDKIIENYFTELRKTEKIKIYKDKM